MAPWFEMSNDEEEEEEVFVGEVARCRKESRSSSNSSSNSEDESRYMPNKRVLDAQR